MDGLTRTSFAILALAWCTLAIPAAAQSDSGTIRVVVTDAKKQPVSLARVLVEGPVRASALTASNGIVEFSDVDDGIYEAHVLKQTYSSATSSVFEVIGHRIVTVRIMLSKGAQLRTIGEVKSRQLEVSSSVGINRHSAQRRLSDDLAGALNKLSGVSVSTNGNDSDATQTISLEGRDASQTQLTLDGIPLNAPGSAGNLGMFASDLFSGASVNLGPGIGGLAGSVNFTTLQPTLSWQTQGALSSGSNGRYNYSIGESGSVGRLGIAVQNVYRLSPSLVDGDRYLDASGQDYVHEGDSNYWGDLVNLQYRISDSQTVRAMFLNSNRTTDLVCLTKSTLPALPCGYGSGNTAQFSTQLYSLTDDAVIGATQVQASVFSMSMGNVYDALNRTVAVLAHNGEIVPSPSPIAYAGAGRNRGFTVNALFPGKERHAFSVQAYGTQSAQSTRPLVAGASAFYSGSASSHYSAVQLTDTIHSSNKLTLVGSIGASAATGGGFGSIASASATWRATSSDAFSASYALTGSGASGPETTVLSDPTSLSFDCNGNVAYGTAPSSSPSRTTSSSARVSYTRTLRSGAVSLALYRQMQNGATIPSYVNGTSLERLLPAGYLQKVQELYDSPGGCNAKAGTPFGAQQLYFMMPVSSLHAIYEGGSVTGSATFGNLAIQPYYDVNVAKAGWNAFFENPYSITTGGNQISGIPIQRGGLVLDYKSPRSILEWLGDAQYVAKNNPNNLPSYVTFDAGVTAQLATGTLTVAASNITNRFGGVFAGAENAVPYRTLAGDLIGTTARPLSPRTLSVTYNVRIAHGNSAGQTGNEEAPADAGPSFSGGPGGGMPALGPGAPPGPFGAGPSSNASRSALSELPANPPAKPLALNENARTCTGQGEADAQRLAAELTTAVGRIEAAKSDSTYPSIMALPTENDTTLTYHGMGNTYAVTITPRQGGIRAIIGCLAVHVARSDDALQRGLYGPSTPLFTTPQLQFMPSVGLYVVPPTAAAGTEEFRLYVLPTKPPSNPFALRGVASCAGDARAIAAQVLNALHAHFATGAVAAGWTIAAHSAKSGTWYELQPGDPTTIPALLRCARVATAGKDELKSRGFEAAELPALNFAPQLGLYVKPTASNP